MAGKTTKNHVVGSHLAKMLESIITHKPMMAKAAPEKILKVFVAIFFESLADIHDQRAHFNLLRLMIFSTFCKTARYHYLLQSGHQRNFGWPILLLARAIGSDLTQEERRKLDTRNNSLRSMFIVKTFSEILEENVAALKNWRSIPKK